MTIARPRSHVSDGLVLMCVGVAGWGLAQLLSHPGLALPSVAAGVVGGAGVIGLGQRSVRRAELVESLRLSLAPLLGPGQRPAGSGLQARRWTRGWPGQPRRVCLRYGVGRVRVGPDEASASSGATVEIGDPRWAGEVTRQASRLLGGTYRVHRHRRGQLILALRAARPEAGEAADTPEVARAKKLVNELLGGTAAIRSVEVDPQTGEVIRLDVKHEVGAKLVAPGYRNRVERTVSVMLPGRWRARWDMEGDSVVFEVRPTLPECLWIEPLAAPSSDPLRNYRQVRIPYGVDEDGEVIAWQPALNPQWLITGSTGSGKTSTGHGILTQITRFGWPVWIADGKGIEFLGFQDWPNVQIVASGIEEQVAVIHRAWQLMEHRYQLVVQRRARPEDFEPLMLMVDEFTDLKANLLAWYGQIKVKGDPTKPATLAEIGSIARKGRTARVHLVLSMQRPDAEILTGEARENLGQRTSMGPLSPEGATMMWNSPVIGVAIPRGRIGRAIGTNNQGLPVELQAYRVPDPKDAAPDSPEGELIARLRPTETRHERLLIVPPVGRGDVEGEQPTFSEFAGADWVKASDRPDLDPLAAGVAAAGGGGRSLSSPLALFGLAPSARRPAPSASELEDDDEVDVDGMSPTGAGVDELADLYADGYGPPTAIRACALSVGDLVCVEEDLDGWAVVEEEPIEDLQDGDFLAIAWRDAQDVSGLLSVSADALVQVRRPV